MEIVLISIVAILLGIGGGMAFSRSRTKGTRWMIWGFITVFIFSWAVCTCLGGLFVFVVDEALAIVPFWIYGVPASIVIGIGMIFRGVYLKMKKIV